MSSQKFKVKGENGSAGWPIALRRQSGKPFMPQGKRVARHRLNPGIGCGARWKSAACEKDRVRNLFRDLESEAENRVPGVTILLIYAAEPGTPK